MDAYDLIISVIALNPDYSNAVKNEGLINRTEFTKRVLSKYPDEILKGAGIRVHEIHGDSAVFEKTMNELIRNKVLKYWADDSLQWDFPLTPREYFYTHIKQSLKDEERSKLEQFVLSLR